MGKLGFGLMRLPVIDKDQNKIDIEKVKDMADDFISAGGTYFDTAYVYHNGYSETAFKEAVVKRYPRESFTIADKLPMFIIKTADEMPVIFDKQLERCGVDYFDYYLLHSLGKISYETTTKIKAFEFVMQKKAEGKIKHVGFSFHDSPELLDKILCEHPETEFVQLQINYLDWEDASIRSKECYEVAVKHKKPVIVMEPVKGGALADVPETAAELFKNYSPECSVASWAIRYTASLENVMTVLSGMSTKEQMQDNLSYMKNFQPLNPEELSIISNAADIIKASISIPCTECRYCIADAECPSNIAIPDYFAIYNNLKRFEDSQKDVAYTYYENLNQTYGKASECIKCGKCEKHCPQHLPIRKYLEHVAVELG